MLVPRTWRRWSRTGITFPSLIFHRIDVLTCIETPQKHRTWNMYCYWHVSSCLLLPSSSWSTSKTNSVQIICCSCSSRTAQTEVMKLNKELFTTRSVSKVSTTGNITRTTGPPDLASTMGRPKAEMTIPVVMKRANSLQALLEPTSSWYLRANTVGRGDRT